MEMNYKKQEIIVKLDKFIRKYYKNRLLRGFIWSLALTAFFFLLFAMLEYYFYFDRYIRASFLFTYAGLLSFVLIRLVIIPGFQLIKIGKLIGYETAAGIIGNHFSEIEDKLLNTLQLIRQNNQTDEANNLLLASIEQKTKVLMVFPFSMAIDFRKNIKYIRLAAIPVVIIFLLIIFAPKTISDPTKRIVRFNETFVKPLPYSIEILNKRLMALQQEDFELQIKIAGEEIPSSIFIKSGEILYKMNGGKGFRYSYTFKSLQADIKFKIIAGDLTSKEYRLVVFPKPIILNFDIALNYPDYTGKKDEVIENQGDVVIPEGTSIRWNFFTKDVTEVIMKFSPEIILSKERSGNRFSFSGSPLKNVNYNIQPVNRSVSLSDSLLYRVMVVSDGYPSIFLTENADSVLPTNLFFKGAIKDDYGFTKLTFNYSFFNEGDSSGGSFVSTGIPLSSQMNSQVFYYSIDLVNLAPDPGKKILYYFEIKDNDQIHGPKATRSELRTIETPTLDEISKKAEENAEFVKDELLKSIKDSKAIKKNIDDLNKKLIDQNNISWQEKKKIEDMLRGAEEIQKRVEDIKKKSQENIDNEEKYLETSERIIEKQKRLNEMMDQLFSEELKKMIDELKALMKQVDKEKLGDLLEKMKMSNKDLENQLDRNLELMKQIEFDRKLEETVSELRKVADSLEQLAKKTENPNENIDKVTEKQNDINRKADSLLSKVDELQEESKKLEDQVDLQNTEKAEDSLKKNLSDSKKNLEKNNRKKAAQSQKKSADNMKELAQQMESANQDAEDESMAEDAQNIRNILENLVRLSFDQEDLINQTKPISKTDPRYLELIVKQKGFSGKMKIIEDSLNAIARRNLEIKPIITKEIMGINQNIDLALESFETRNIGAVVIRQQYAMTSINNLALLLNESLEKMNQQMSSSMQSKSGNKSCNNPKSKGGKKSAKDMKDAQGKIGEQIKKLKEGMERGKKPGNASKAEQQGLNKEIAKLAAQQEALRSEMQKYQDELGAKGVKDLKGLKDAARDMEQNEKDLVNKQISQETINRQQRILTRLLESENAEQIREREERRESVESKNQKYSNLGKNFEYKRDKRGSLDQLQYMLPALRSFYRTKVNNYVVKIEQ